MSHCEVVHTFIGVVVVEWGGVSVSRIRGRMGICNLHEIDLSFFLSDSLPVSICLKKII